VVANYLELITNALITISVYCQFKDVSEVTPQSDVDKTPIGVLASLHYSEL